jgi:sugar phosphate isomerase/epimerase
MNISNSLYDLEKFGGQWHHLEKFIKKHQLDGIELILYKDRYLDKIDSNHLIGLHLRYFPTWLEFYNNDQDALIEMFDTKEAIKAYYGGLKPEVLVDVFKEEYESAKKLSVEYMVYHVGHVTNADAFSFEFDYSDEDVLEATVDLVNKAFDQDSEIDLLFENLWWPGMNLLDQEKTKKFLDQINYKNKGIMLDLSHLMITNPSIRTPREATDYILEKINALGDLKEYIKGIHLNMSISGDYIKKNHVPTYKKIQKLSDGFEKYQKIVEHIKRIDQHLPYDDSGIHEIIALVKPEYIVFEFSSKTYEEIDEFAHQQNKILNRL